jgi:HAD superfamily hydrolase (TIGR01509 family)
VIPRLITFDLDDTLWDNRPVIANAEAVQQQWLAEHAPRLANSPADALSQARGHLLQVEPALKHRLSELRRRSLQHALQVAGYHRAEAQNLAERAFQVMLEARHSVCLFPDTLSTLKYLASRYRLGVITNGNADVRRLGLAEYFSVVLCAEQLGVGKPDGKPFREALRLSGVDAAQAVHVGDDAEHDIAGARAAGWRAVWFNPAAKAWAERAPADAEVRHLAELPALLERWSRGL